ncbi:MAG: Crp/Fnr family transcriptional regulator [Chloroflexota bacterium]
MPVPFDKETKQLIEKIPYFQNLEEAILKYAAEEIQVRHFEAGRVLFSHDDEGAGLHLVVTGLCKVYYISPDGREQILYKLNPGDYCNEVSVVDGGPNPANFATIEDSKVWVLTETSMLRLRQRFPVLNDVILRNIAGHARQLARRVYQLTFLSVTSRLAFFLLQQSDEHGQLQRRQWPQDEVAAYLGTVRDVVSRSFKELRENNLIEMDRRTIQILDRDGLQILSKGG